MGEDENSLYDINNAKILILIASYCDDQLLNTVRSALIQADNKDRLYFSICYQSDNLDDYEELKKINNCRIKYLKAQEARGSCYARNLCKQMIEDEKYVFQIDSHMRFVKHWDNKLIEQLLSLNDPNASISFYPPNCTEEMMKLPLDDKVFDNPGQGCRMYARNFRQDAFPFLKIESMLLSKNNESFKKNPFISAGNFFSFSKIYGLVLEDPEMYFYGDELPMAIRYYTYGLNNYSGKESYIYHEYVKKGRKLPTYNNASINEQERFLNLLNLNGDKNILGQYGLGDKRTLEEFQDFSGIDFKNKKIYMNAEVGEFEDDKYRNKVSYLKGKTSSIFEKQSIKSKIEILIIDVLGEYQECIDSCLRKAQNKDDISFIVGTVSADISETKHIKKIIQYSEDDFYYSKVLSDLTSYLGDCYVSVVDSSFRFLYGWDKYFLDIIKTCGDNAVLTSWIWYTTDLNKAEKLGPYLNLVKEFKKFSNYLPELKYNEEIKIVERKMPYQTPFISDGFLFCNSEILKTIKIDPNLTYREQERIYSLRLWTNGIDIFYPRLSYMYKTKSDEMFNKGESHYSTICALLGMDNYYSKFLEEKYPYDVGKERTLWSWYDFMKFDYAADDSFVL